MQYPCAQIRLTGVDTKGSFKYFMTLGRTLSPSALTGQSFTIPVVKACIETSPISFGIARIRGRIGNRLSFCKHNCSSNKKKELFCISSVAFTTHFGFVLAVPSLDSMRVWQEPV